MLTRLDLDDFKCFQVLKLPLGRLTLLSGANASGKSSALQALVLLHQTIREQEWSTRLLLNGGELCLGTVTDVVDKVYGRRMFGIGLIDDDREIHWTFEGDRREMSAAVSAVQIGAEQHRSPSSLRFLFPTDTSQENENLAGRLRRLSYLTAERVGPREIYPLGDPGLTEVVGPRGESAASLLHWGRDEGVAASLVRKGHAQNGSIKLRPA